MNTAVISILFAILLFRTIEISWGFYFIIFLILIALTFINFQLSKNHDLYVSFLTINFTTLIVYCLNNFYENNTVVATLADRLYILFIILSLVAICYLLTFSKFSIVKIEKDKPIIMKKREKDLKRVKVYLEHFQIIGLNGRWGTGKSFIVSVLKDQVKDDYDFIEIDLRRLSI